jgi:acarbose 7IV-phosphotransferase
MFHKKITIIGGTTYDHIVTLPQLPSPIPKTIHTAPFHEGTGSTGSGKALAFTKLSVPNTLYSVLGDDYYGHAIVKDLTAQGVQLVYNIDPAGTERHINIMDAEGQRISMFITQSSEDIDFNKAAIQQLLDDSDIIVLNIISYCKQLISMITAQQKPVWTDLHDYDGQSIYHQPFIEAAQYIHLSSDNLPDYRTTMQELISKGKRLVICTHGKAGASLLTSSGEWLEQSIIPGLSIADSNGAGDSFFSGFLYAYLQEMSLQKCLQYGAICGGYAVCSKGLVYEHLSAPFMEEKWIQYFGH